MELNFMKAVTPPVLSDGPSGSNVNVIGEISVLEADFKKQISIWGSRFAPLIKEDSVVICLIENFKFFKISPSVLKEHLKELSLFAPVQSIIQLPNQNFTYLKFENRVQVNKFIENTVFLDMKRVYYVTGEEKIKHVYITIDRIPLDILEDQLPVQLRKWGKVINIMPVLVPKSEGNDYHMGRSKVEFLLHEGVTVENLPYYVTLLQMKIYIHIPGRPRICFRCGELNHLVSACDKKYCKICRRSLPISHSCRRTYAQTLLPPTGVEEDSEVVAIDEAILSDMQTAHEGGVVVLPSVENVELLKGALVSDRNDSCVGMSLDTGNHVIDVPNKEQMVKGVCDGEPGDLGDVQAGVGSQSARTRNHQLIVDADGGNKVDSSVLPDSEMEVAASSKPGEGSVSVELSASSSTPRELVRLNKRKRVKSSVVSLEDKSTPKVYSLRSGDKHKITSQDSLLQSRMGEIDKLGSQSSLDSSKMQSDEETESSMAESDGSGVG